MKKRGQIGSETLVYVLTIVIVGLILVMGYRYFSSTSKIIDKAELLQFQNKLLSDMQSVSNDYGTFKKISYAVPRNLEEICFIDLNKKGEILSSKLISYYPLIEDSISDGLDRNVFFAGAAELHSSYADGIIIDHYPYFVCFGQKNRKVEIGVEGSAGGKSLILAEFVTKANIQSGKSTILRSADGIISLEIPPGAATSTDFVSIEMIEPASDISSGASDLYKFEPVGTTFSSPAKLTIKYNPKEVGECPPALNFRQFSEDGSEKLDTQSKSVDCESKTAIFEINKLV